VDRSLTHYCLHWLQLMTAPISMMLVARVAMQQTFQKTGMLEASKLSCLVMISIWTHTKVLVESCVIIISSMVQTRALLPFLPAADSITVSSLFSTTGTTLDSSTQALLKLIALSRVLFL